jgi:hypothetical protein
MRADQVSERLRLVRQVRGLSSETPPSTTAQLNQGNCMSKTREIWGYNVLSGSKALPNAVEFSPLKAVDAVSGAVVTDAHASA